MENEVKICIEIPDDLKNEVKSIRSEQFPELSEEELYRLAIRWGLDSQQEKR